ncbi:hypothetical protein KY348_00120 [Candidatus Woesearchaeota archaeon]|nr:hypothetical protein [Candidatus Woesearchaeota archaeon]
MKLYHLFILSIILLFIAGCSPKCPKCPNPTTWSQCSEAAMKSRTNYRCNENFECESFSETQACKTEILMSGKNIEARLSPSIESNVKGIIQVEALKVPKATEFVVFLFYPQDVQLSSNMDEEDAKRVLREIDVNEADGWSVFIDTTKFNNGIYNIFIGPSKEDASEESPWLAYTQTQIVVNN